MSQDQHRSSDSAPDKPPGWLCTAVGWGATPFAVALAVWSGGAGHGDYLFARLFFPGRMLLTLLTENRITMLTAALAVVQLPIYGLLIDRRGLVGLLIVAVAHAVTLAPCLCGAIPNFS